MSSLPVVPVGVEAVNSHLTTAYDLAALTHIGIAESSLDDILSIVARIQGGG